MNKGLFWRIWAAMLVLAILWLGWVLRTPQPAAAQNSVAEVVTAKSFQVVDDQGNRRATLGMAADEDRVNLEFYDADGGLHAFLAVLPEGGTLFYLLDPDGRGRLRLFVSDEGAPSIYLNGDHLNARAVLDVLADGQPRLGLMDAESNVRCDLTVNADGSPRLILRDAEHNPRVGLGARDDGSWGVEVKDGEGESLFSAP